MPFLVPVAITANNRGVLAEVVGVDPDHHKPRAESIGELADGVIIMLGAISQRARVQERDLGPDLGLKALPQPLGGRLVVPDQVALHERVAQDDSPDRRTHVRLSAAAAPGVGRLNRPIDDFCPGRPGQAPHFGCVGKLENADVHVENVDLPSPRSTAPKAVAGTGGRIQPG